MFFLGEIFHFCITTHGRLFGPKNSLWNRIFPVYLNFKNKKVQSILVSKQAGAYLPFESASSL